MRPERVTKAGIGTTAIGGKFDFYGDERRGISVAVYPHLEFAPAVAGRATLDSRGPRHQARAQAARRDASLHTLRDSLARGRRRHHDSRVFDRRSDRAP